MLVQCSLPYPTCHTRTCRFHTMLVQYSLPYPTSHTRTGFIWCWYNTVYRARHATQEQVSYDVGTIQFTVPDMPHKNRFHLMLVPYSLPCPTCHTRTGFIRCWYNTVYRTRHATQGQFSYDVGTIQFTVPDMPHKNRFHTMLVQYSSPYPTSHTRTVFIRCWYNTVYRTRHATQEQVSYDVGTVQFTVPDMPHKNMQVSYDVGTIQFTVPDMPHKNRFHTMLVQYSLPYPTCHTRTGFIWCWYSAVYRTRHATQEHAGFIRCWYNTVYRTRHATQGQFSHDVGTIQFTVPDMPHKNRFHTMLVPYSLPCPTCHTRTGFTRCWYNTVYRTQHPTQEQVSYDVGTI